MLFSLYWLVVFGFISPIFDVWLSVGVIRVSGDSWHIEFAFHISLGESTTFEQHVPLFSNSVRSVTVGLDDLQQILVAG